MSKRSYSSLRSSAAHGISDLLQAHNSMAHTSHPTPPTLAATATTSLKVFATLDPDTNASVQTNDYRHVFAPSSIHLPQDTTRESFAAHLDPLREVMRSFPVRSRQVWPNPSLHQVMIWADSEAEFRDNVKDTDDDAGWGALGESISLFLTMDQAGDKVRHVLEFLDSKATDRVILLVARAFEQKGKLARGNIKREGKQK